MDIFQYIKTQENAYQTTPVPIVDGWEWSMPDHVKLTTLYINSKYSESKGDNPFKNIVLPALNLQHRAVQYDLKEIKPYVTNKSKYHNSFLLKKAHDRWALRKLWDVTLDKISETWTDYGGVLLKRKGASNYEVVPWQRIAFVDQTNILSSPICEVHQMTPKELSDMKSKGWKNVDEVIILSQNNNKESTQTNGIDIKTPGKFITVYEIHGYLPKSYINENDSDTEYSQQMHIVTFYQDETGQKQGITLFSGNEKKSPYKYSSREDIEGRGLGRGAVEELFEEQVWTNYSIISQKELLDQATKMLYQTADHSFSSRNRITELENGEILVHDGSGISQINTQPTNFAVFQSFENAWNESRKDKSASYDSATGADTSSIPFRLGMMRNEEAMSVHKYRKSKLKHFLEEVYRDWIIIDLSKEITTEEFLSSLSLDELREISESVIENGKNDILKRAILGGKIVTEEDIANVKNTLSNEFFKSDKKFISLLKEDFEDVEMDVRIEIGNQESSLMAEKLGSIFSQVAQNPQVLENPYLANIFNSLIEYSGLSPIQYGAIAKNVGVAEKQPVSPEALLEAKLQAKSQ